MELVKIYNANQIGGCVTVISSVVDGVIHRIMIDYGCNLESTETGKELDYPWKKKPVDAVFFTHYHGDHVGRIMEIPRSVPKYMGDVSRKIMSNIKEALAGIDDADAAGHRAEYELLNSDGIITFKSETDADGRIVPPPAIEIPGFHIEPIRVDHSAYDAYMFLIEVTDETGKKKVILHTGDFRGHGRIGKGMIPDIYKYVLKCTDGDPGKPERPIDILIIEGTMMSRSSEKVMTEEELQQMAEEYLTKHKYVFLVCSSTNFDSLTGFYQAAQSAARRMYPDNPAARRYFYTYSYYGLKQLETFKRMATEGDLYGDYNFEYIDVLKPDRPLISAKNGREYTQRELMLKSGFVALIKPEADYEKYIDDVMKAYLAGEIDEKPVIIFSMWNGYIDKKHPARKPRWIEFVDRQEKRPKSESGVNCRIEVNRKLHTSGHASIEMIEAVINAVRPREAIMPMHTECAGDFMTLNIDPELLERIKYIDYTTDKNDTDWDCRAIPEKFLKRFESDRVTDSPASIGLKPFLDLVNSHPELQFCLRGNSYSNGNPLSGGKVCIYRNNHAMFVLKPESLQINPNYFRYHSDWESDLSILTGKEYGFNEGKPLSLEKIKRSANPNPVSGQYGYSCSFKKSAITVKYSADLFMKLNSLYELMSRVFDDYFDEKLTADCFLEWAVSKNYYESNEDGPVPEEYIVNHKNRKLEKIRQQELYSLMKYQKDGYFFYDMEFQQKHKSQDDLHNDPDNNKPDMQAIRFDAKGNPAAWVFVEVKCTEAAMTGDSGLAGHLDKMRRYLKNEANFVNRKREVLLLLTQYEKLGLIKMNMPISPRVIDHLNREILLVFTDETLAMEDEIRSSVGDAFDRRKEFILPDKSKALLISP